MKFYCLVSIIIVLGSCSGGSHDNSENVTVVDDSLENKTFVEFNIEDDIEAISVPVFDEIDRLGTKNDSKWTTLFWGDFSFELPFEEFEIQEKMATDNFEKKIIKIYRGVIYSIRLSDYGEEMIGNENFDIGFLYYRHRSLTEGTDILSEIKFSQLSKKSPAIYSCYKYQRNDKYYFEDLLTVKHEQFIFEMSVTGSPLHENFQIVKRFFDSFILL